eukprot:GEMP01055298.1.p1 GENE.GEMP01055298.1~~GEMP01055298.1.p1  ORF type:complete len:203 (+),score=49.30 GEMP01055298.1:91-699(+)
MKFARLIVLCSMVALSVHGRESAEEEAPEGMGTFGIGLVNKLKDLRSGVITAIDATIGSMPQEEADKLTKWKDDWMSIFGIYKGITGLAGDFAVNYFGREEFHKKNGPLISAAKKAKLLFGNFKSTSTYDLDMLRIALQEITGAGKRIFKEGGALHTMLTELHNLLDVSSAGLMLEKLTKSPELHRFFALITGPRMTSSEEL